jgi:hypothetical protein
LQAGRFVESRNGRRGFRDHGISIRHLS